MLIEVLPDGAADGLTDLRADAAAGLTTDALSNGSAGAALRTAQPHPEQRARKVLDVWLLTNWVVVVGDHIEGHKPIDPARLRALLREHRALDVFKRGLQDMPYEWRVAYNGLDLAWRLRADDAALALFYRRLRDLGAMVALAAVAIPVASAEAGIGTSMAADK